MIQDFRDLRVWQAGMDLVVKMYQLTSSFPKTEQFGLTNQIRRAIVSVPSNIAEGHSRRSTKEFLHHLSIAHASFSEVITQIDIAGRLGFVDLGRLSEILEETHSLSRQLTSLRKAVEKNL